MDWLKNTVSAILGKEPLTPAQKCKEMLAEVSSDFRLNLNKEGKELKRIEKQISYLLQKSDTLNLARLEVASHLQVRRQIRISEIIINYSEMLIPKAESLYVDEEGDWTPETRTAIASLNYLSKRLSTSKKLNNLLSCLKVEFNGKHCLGRTTKFLPQEVTRMFGTINPSNFHRDVLLADIAARNCGLERVAVQLPTEEYAIHLQNVLEALYLV